MTIAILNKKHHSKSPYEIWLKDLNEEIVLFTSKETFAGFDKNNYLHIEKFDNYETNFEVEKKLVELNEKFNFTKIIALSEYDILRAGKLREKLGIEGQSNISSESFRNKILMKNIAKQNGINTPHFQTVYSPDCIVGFIANNGYPVVVKPIYGSGSENTYIISNLEEVEAFLLKSNINDKPLQIETYVEGDMFHVDGLVCDGKIKFSSVSKYHIGCLAFKEGKPLSSYILKESNPLVYRLNEETKILLKALPTPENTSFHAEFFLTKKDEIVLCEIASRTGGGKIEQVIDKTFGVNLNKLSVQSQCGLKIDLPKNKNNILLGFTLIPPITGTFEGIKHDIPFDWVVEFNLIAKTGTHYKTAKHSVDYIASAIIKGHKEEEIIERIDKLIQWLDFNIIWKKNSSPISR